MGDPFDAAGLFNTAGAAIAIRIPSDLPPARSWHGWLRAEAPDVSMQPPLFVLPPAARAPVAPPDRIRTVRLVPEQAPELPDVAAMATRLGIAMAEVLDGRRAVEQLERHVMAAVLDRLASCADVRPHDRRGRVRLHSLRVQLTTAHSAEACLHITARRRLLLAYRLAGRGSRWVCSELETLAPCVVAPQRLSGS